MKRFSDSNEADRSELNNVKDAVARLEEHVMTISQSLEEMKSVLSSTESARIGDYYCVKINNDVYPTFSLISANKAHIPKGAQETSRNS